MYKITKCISFIHAFIRGNPSNGDCNTYMYVICFVNRQDYVICCMIVKWHYAQLSINGM